VSHTLAASAQTTAQVPSNLAGACQFATSSGLPERLQGGQRQHCCGLARPCALAAYLCCDALSLTCGRRRA